MVQQHIIYGFPTWIHCVALKFMDCKSCRNLIHGADSDSTAWPRAKQVWREKFVEFWRIWGYIIGQPHIEKSYGRWIQLDSRFQLKHSSVCNSWTTVFSSRNAGLCTMLADPFGLHIGSLGELLTLIPNSTREGRKTKAMQKLYKLTRYTIMHTIIRYFRVCRKQKRIPSHEHSRDSMLNVGHKF